MRTPIFDFLKNYADKNTARLHMPGHKGMGILGVEAYDITEIQGADVLYSPTGIIAESEGYATELFGTAHSYYSTEGSTLAMRGMLALIKFHSEGRAKILATRNAHSSFITAMALLDLDAVWLYSEKSGHLCSANVTAEEVERAICENCGLSAVYLTSPDYLGNIADVEGIAKVCRAHNLPLLVDNAHGAYLNFLPENRHPIALGAAMCSDSAHKTLPALTGGAYLHISKDFSEYCTEARDALRIFASTSPSYLILASLDLCNARLGGDYRERLALAVEKIDGLKHRLSCHGYSVMDTEPMKFVIRCTEYGYTGEEIAGILRECGIVAEFYDREYLVLMFGADTLAGDYDRLESSLLGIARRKEIPMSPPTLTTSHTVALSPREALLSPCETITSKDAVGRICASLTVSCPPAVPIVVCGEVIRKEDMELCDYYGVDYLKVVKQSTK